MQISPDHIRSLHKYEIRLLKSLEYLMNRYTWVPVKDLIHNSRLSESEVNFRLSRLMEKGMVKYEAVPYPGYSLLFNGYDALAISHLVAKGVINSLGSCIGEGKESHVYEAIGTGIVILKIHRLGQRSFQTVRRSRGFLPENAHCPWIFASHYSAEQEYLALNALQRAIHVPIPLAMNRNIIAMTYIAGTRLCDFTPDNPDEIFSEITRLVKTAYSCGYIHGDLSEYNIMVDEKDVWIIDWPQWVSPEHENAIEILEHDLKTICAYFSRKFQILYNPEEIMRELGR